MVNGISLFRRGERLAASGALLVAALLCGAGCSGIDYETWGAPLKGAGHVVVLFHGFGAPASDLKSLAIDLKQYGAPADTCYVLAEGPHSAGNGRSWYRNGEDLGKLRPKVIGLIDSLMKKSGLMPRKVFLAGFSQGAVVAVDAALHYFSPLGGVLAFSGPQDPTGNWGLDPVSPEAAKTPYFISHGRSDSVAGPGASEGLKKLLEGRGNNVELLLFDGGHTIPREAAQAAGRFLETNGR